MFPKIFALTFPRKDLDSEVLEIALARCEAAGLTSLVREILPNIIFGKYESLIRSAPWHRHPYTANLKEICAILRVRIFGGLQLPWTELIFI